MRLLQISISFINDENGESEEVEVYQISAGESNIEYNVLNENVALARVSLETEPGEIGKLPSGEKFLLIDKIVEHNLDDYLSALEELKEEKDETLIKIGRQLPELIANAIEVPEAITVLCELIITAKLNNEDLSKCLEWLEVLADHSIKVNDLLTKLKKLHKEQNGFEIEDIQDIKTLNKISGLYRGLKAYKKAKLILLKSLQLDANNIITLVSLGSICRVKREFEEGIFYYEKSLEIKEDSFAYNGLGGIYRDLNEPEKAARCFQEALTLESNNGYSSSHRGLGAAFYDIEYYIEGNKHFKLAGPSERILVNSNETKARSMNQEAIDVLRLILKQDKNNKWAKILIEEQTKKG